MEDLTATSVVKQVRTAPFNERFGFPVPLNEERG
jgi:hypothetical protein